MADVDLTIRGVKFGATQAGTLTVASETATAVGDYILVLAEALYQDSTATLAINPTAGVDSWVTINAANTDGTTVVQRAFLGRVNTSGARSVTVKQYAPASDPSELHVHVYTLNASGGDVTVDGSSSIVDRATPYAHTAISPAGTKDLLVAFHGGVQFSGTLTYGIAPSGMTVGAANYYNQYTGMQSVYQVLTAAGSTGSKSQTSNITTLSGGAGMMLALRAQTSTTNYPAGAAHAAAGALSVTARQQHAAGSGFAGAGALGATARQDRAVASAQSAEGVLGASASVRQPATAPTMSAAGALGASATRIHFATSSMAATSSTNLSLSPSGTSSLSGESSMGASASQRHASAAANAGAGALVAAASQDMRVVAAHAAAGAMSADARRVHPAVANLSASGASSFDGRRVHTMSATLGASGTVGASATHIRAASVNLGAFGTFQARPAAAAGGALNVSVYGIDPATAELIPLPDFESVTISPILNENGAIELRYPATGKNFNRLRSNITSDRDIEVEVWISGRRASALRGILMESSGDDVDEDAVWSFTGPMLNYLVSEIIVYPQAGAEKLELLIASATAGKVIRTIVEQSKSRGGLAGLTLGFSDSVDSNGLPWGTTVTTKFSPGVTGKAVLDQLVSLGLCEWEITADRVLKAYAPGTFGIDRTVGADPVVLRRGRQVPEAPRKHSVRNSPTSLLAAGSEGIYETANDPSALSRRGRRVEGFASANNLEDSGAVYGFAQTALNASSSGVMELTQGVEFTPGDPRPGASYNVGDWVFADTRNKLERLRIKQWTLTVDRDGASGTVTLGDLISERAATLQRRLEALSNGTATVGTSSPSEDTGIPKPPTGLVVGSVPYTGPTGESLATVTAGWTAVTQNTDGNTATDISGYNVEYRYNSGVTVSGWLTAGPTNGTQKSFGDVSSNVNIEVRVQTVDNSNNVSEWTYSSPHLTATDTTPPAIPSNPNVDNYLGVIRIAWDGKTSTGSDMPINFDYVEVHVSTSAAFEPDATTLFGRLYAQGTSVYTDGAYGTTYYARLVAVNTGGFKSTASGVGSATPERVVGLDVFDGAIGTAKLADAAITTAKINDLAVNDAKIGSLNVAKLTTGTFSASMTLSGVIQTAASGQRMVIDSSGWKGYNSSGVIFAQLNILAATLLVTGTYQSGLSGERINILPDGTFRIYPATGTNYSQIANNGTDVVWRGPLGTGNRSGRFNVNGNGVGMNYSAETELNNLRSEVVALDRYVGINAPVILLRATGRWSPPDGNGRRIGFIHTDSSGKDISESILHYITASNSGYGGFVAPANNSGILFASGRAMAVTGDGNGFQIFKAQSYEQDSSEMVKEAIADVRTIFDPKTAIKNARAKKFVYTGEKWYTPPATEDNPNPAPIPVTPPTRVGVIAEQLPPVMVHESPNPDGSTTKAVDLASWIGMLHGGLNQVFDQEIRTVHGAVTISPVASLIWLPGKTYEVPVTWDSVPLDSVQGAIPRMDVGIAWQGKLSATVKTGSVTNTGCTVVVKVVSSTQVVITAGLPLTVHADGIYLYTPPFTG